MPSSKRATLGVVLGDDWRGRQVSGRISHSRTYTVRGGTQPRGLAPSGGFASPRKFALFLAHHSYLSPAPPTARSPLFPQFAISGVISIVVKL